MPALPKSISIAVHTTLLGSCQQSHQLCQIRILALSTGKALPTLFSLDGMVHPPPPPPGNPPFPLSYPSSSHVSGLPGALHSSICPAHAEASLLMVAALNSHDLISSLTIHALRSSMGATIAEASSGPTLAGASSHCLVWHALESEADQLIDCATVTAGSQAGLRATVIRQLRKLPPRHLRPQVPLNE